MLHHLLAPPPYAMNVIGEDNRDPTTAELDSMVLLVKQAMEEGAMGVGTSLIYPPAFFAKTEELIALCKEASALRRVLYQPYAERRE